MSTAMGTRLHINLYIYIYIYKTTSMPHLVLLSQHAQSDEKVILSRWNTDPNLTITTY